MLIEMNKEFVGAHCSFRLDLPAKGSTGRGARTPGLWQSGAADRSTTMTTAQRSTSTRKPRSQRMARIADVVAEPLIAMPEAALLPLSKLDKAEALLLADQGTTIDEIMAAIGWQRHSVRGAIAGALKKRGLVIASEKVGDMRRYRASRPA